MPYMIGLDPMYFVYVAPALLLGLWAQWRVRSTYAAASQVPASLSGAAAARYVLKSAGLDDIAIEEIPGQLTDHYDPQAKVLRLSQEVFRGNTMASVGIAAHEAGHALQDAERYVPLVLRNAAVPAANFGSKISMFLLMIGLMLSYRGGGVGHTLVILGLGAFALTVVVQLINLPVEFDASARAKRQLVQLGVIDQQGLQEVSRVLGAAAWTYVAGTLQTVMTLLYYVSLFAGGDRRRE